MNDDRSDDEHDERSWLEKIAQIFSSDPRTRKDLLDILVIAEQNDVIDAETHGIMQGALEVANLQVRDVMIPRPQMVCLRSDEDPEQIVRRVIEAGHSRYPVIGDTSDDVLGILLAKDMLGQMFSQGAAGLDIGTLLRPATFIPESKRLNVLLREFRENRNHIAIVIDEYGGVAGLVTIEDVLEEIVGEIEDEHDKQQDTFIKKLSENDYLIKALTPIEEFNDYFDARLSDDEFDTIGGIVMQKFGHLPRRNEVAEIEGFHFKVLNADSRQIHLLRLNLDPGASGG
jgi:magnesium and cobalt transporter